MQTSFLSISAPHFTCLSSNSSWKQPYDWLALDSLWMVPRSSLITAIRRKVRNIFALFYVLQTNCINNLNIFRRSNYICIHWVQLVSLQSHTSAYSATSPAVSRRLPTAATCVRSQVRSCGTCGGQSGAGTGFLRVLRLLPVTSHSNCSILICHPGWYNRRISGRRRKWTQYHPTPRRKKLLLIT
jgi:hypothetical protein